MKYDFDHELQRFGTYSMKWDDDAFFRAMDPNIRRDRDTIRLELADMDFPAAPAIVKAMHRVADFANYGYVTAGAAPEYKPSIIGWYRRRHGVEVRPEWIVHANGALDGIEQTIRAFSRPGDGVILCRPVYRNFTGVIERTGRHAANCQMLHGESGDYTMDWENLEKVCAKPENKVFILCSPQNPVGRVWTREELSRVAEICRRSGVVLVSDEIHSDIVRRWARHIPIIDAAEDLSNIIMVSGVNKTFNLMGLHCAYAVIPDKALREKYLAGYEPPMPTAFALAGMIAAYKESEDWADELNAYLDDTLTAVVARIGEKLPKVKAYVPEGSYILWLDFAGYGYDTATLLYLINQRANVSVQSGVAHDPDQSDTFVRLCVTCSKATVFEAVDRIAKAFEEYEAEKSREEREGIIRSHQKTSDVRGPK